MSKSQGRSRLRMALATALPAYLPAGLFSIGVNLFALTIPLYLMQLFDHVLTSRSLDSLVYLTVIALAAILTMALLDLARSNIAARIGIWLDRDLAADAYGRAVAQALRGRDYTTQSLRDLASVRNFAGGSSLFVLFDALWTPVYLLVVFHLHPLLGLVSLAGVVMLGALALVNEWASRGPVHEGNLHSAKAQRGADMAARNAEAVEAMAMLDGLIARWQAEHDLVLDANRRAANRGAMLMAFTKFVRSGLQVAILCAGAFLAIGHEITGGAMIGASILMGRALAPVEQAIGLWKQFVAGREGLRRLERFFAEPQPRGTTAPPPPHGNLSVEAVSFTPPGAAAPVLRAAGFQLAAGEVLAVVGPSAAGKSTLARLLVGAWKPDAGVVRLDGADVWSWPRRDFGRHVGYLPQDIELFPGTIRDNIARMGQGDAEAVFRAARLAGVHEMILRLPDGYDTEVGEGGLRLSGGQRQRVALARAVYGGPRLVVLDEPNANLDGEGDMALAQAVASLRRDGATVVVITHRQRLLGQADKILLLRNGIVEVMGERDAVLAQLVPDSVAAAQSKLRKSG